MKNDQHINIFDIGHYRSEDGPGIRTNLFFKGCPLRCKWCSNPFGLSAKQQLVFNQNKCVKCGACIDVCPKDCNDFRDNEVITNFRNCDACGACVSGCPTKARTISGKKISLEEAYREITKDAAFYRRTGGGITLSGGEVLLQYEPATELLRRCRKSLINIAVETSAYAPSEHLKVLSEQCDVVFIDQKIFNNEKHRKYTGVDNGIIIKNIRILHELTEKSRQLKIIIRRPVINGINDSESEIIAFSEFLNELDGFPSVNLLPYHNLGSSKYAMIGLQYEMDALQMSTKEEMESVRGLIMRYAPRVKVTIGGGELE